MEKPKKRRWGRAVLIVLVVLLSVPTLLRAFVVESFKTPAGSMIPTLLIGDHFFITKTGYAPRRGDVVVFTSPRDESIDFVKRIVAIGGDTIELRDGVIHLDKNPIKRRRLKAPCSFTDLDDSGGYTKRPCVAFEEELDAGRYQVIQDQEGMDRDFAPKKVPANHVFVMGDNRDNSHDSRFMGTVPVTLIKGRASVIWRSSGPEGSGLRWKDIHEK